MSGDDDLFNDMLMPPWTRRSDPCDDDAGFETLLSGQPLPLHAPGETRLLADVVGALSAAGTVAECRGQATASAAFRAQFGTPSPHGRTPSRRPAMLLSLLGTKLAVVTAAGAVGLGGVAAAAYAGALPETAQNIAHHLIDAPAAHHKHAKPGSGTPVGPDPSGPAAHGLCTAYQHATAHGQAARHSVALTTLIEAAGGAGKVAAYCAGVEPPSSHASRPTDVDPTHPTGKPETPGSAGRSHAATKTHGKPDSPGHQSAAHRAPASP